MSAPVCVACCCTMQLENNDAAFFRRTFAEKLAAGYYCVRYACPKCNFQILGDLSHRPFTTIHGKPTPDTAIEQFLSRDGTEAYVEGEGQRITISAPDTTDKTPGDP